MIIKLLVEGGDMKAGPAIAQQLGPIGINIGKVISEINNKTKEFKGIKIPVELDIDKNTKTFAVHIFSPPTSELIRKELNLEKGTSNHSNFIVGNASIEDVIKIAKIKFPNMLERNLKNAVKSVLGTCRSVGILVENKNPNEVIKDVEDGKYDREINSESTITPSEKRKEINEFYAKIKQEQENKLKLAQKIAEEAEAKKTQEVKAAIQEEKKAPVTALKTAPTAPKKEKKK